MTKQEKIKLIQELQGSFEKSNAVIVCDYKGLSVQKLETLRKMARVKGTNVRVVKNTLALIALSNAKKNGLEFSNTNIIVWSNDQISLSKLVVEFASSNDKFIIKTGYFEGDIVSKSHIEKISKLPSKNELISMLLSTWTAPARYFVSGLDNLRKQKENAEV